MKKEIFGQRVADVEISFEEGILLIKNFIENGISNVKQVFTAKSNKGVSFSSTNIIADGNISFDPFNNYYVLEVHSAKSNANNLNLAFSNESNIILRERLKNQIELYFEDFEMSIYLNR